MRYASGHAGQTGRQADTDGHILHYRAYLAPPFATFGAKVVINSEAVKAIKGDLCKGAFI